MLRVNNTKIISVTDESRLGIKVETEFEGKWYTLRISYENESITLQELGEPMLLNKIARAIDSVIQDADLRKHEGGNICKACKQEFTAKDPDEDICPACKIDEAEYKGGER